MKIEAVDLRRINIPMIAPFRVSFGVEHHRDILLVRVIGGEAEGWGECVAMSRPLYSAEYVDGAEDVIRRHLLPRLFEAGEVAADQVGEILRPIHGHPMAKAALEMAVLDAGLRGAGISLAEYLGAVRTEVDCGVSVGIHEDPAELVEVVGGYLAEGYRRIKLKIEPGYDVEAVRAVREHFPDILLQVDANTAYTLDDTAQLAKLDEFDLLLIEQPLAEDDVRGHAELARLLRTPICLDESITSSRVGRGRHRPRRVPHRQHQGRPGGWLSRGRAASTTSA